MENTIEKIAGMEVFKNEETGMELHLCKLQGGKFEYSLSLIDSDAGETVQTRLCPSLEIARKIIAAEWY